MTQLPDLSGLTHEEKDALILALWSQVQAVTARVAELEARLAAPPKTPDNSSLPPSKGKKANREDKAARAGPRLGSLGRSGGGRTLCASPDEILSARPIRCAHCHEALVEADQVLHGRYDKVDLPRVAPVVTRVERYAACCRCCGATTLAPVPEGLEAGTPFSIGIVALALYLCVVHAISYRRLSRLLLELFGLAISEGALDAAFHRSKPRFDARRGCHPCPAAPRSRGVLGRDQRAHRRPHLLELGFPEQRRGDPCHPSQPRHHSGGRGAGRAPSGAVGVRSLRGAAWPCRGLAGLPGPPVARLHLRHRGW